MPRMGSEIYAAHMNNVLKLAAREGGVSRAQLMKELNITRPVANALIEKCGLEIDRKEGRTEYFSDGTRPTPPKKQSKPETITVAEPVSDATGDAASPHEAGKDLNTPVDMLAELDDQIIDTRNALAEAAVKSGKALGEWAKHQALVDALRERLSELAARRMRASS